MIPWEHRTLTLLVSLRLYLLLIRHRVGACTAGTGVMSVMIWRPCTGHFDGCIRKGKATSASLWGTARGGMELEAGRGTGKAESVRGECPTDEK